MPLQEDLLPLCDELLLAHAPNRLLLLKFDHYIYQAREENYLFSERLGTLLDRLTEYINIQNEKYSK